MSGPVFESDTGKIFDLQHFCLDDGPGIRTTVFLKGCPLRCIWCHNPESYEYRDTISYNRAKCNGCGECAAACPVKCYEMIQGEHRFARENCTRCGLCAQVCCYGALVRIGRTVSVDEVLREVKKDKTYYEKPAQGGMTVSGGEPLFQPHFLKSLLKKAKEEGIHTCVETSGYGSPCHLKAILPHTDLFLFDIKGTRAGYPLLTGVSADHIYENLELLMESDNRVIIRVPLVPGINDTEEFFDELEQLYHRYPQIEIFEIMPYHGLGASKAEQVAVTQGMEKQSDAGEEQKEVWLAGMKQRGVPAAINYFKSR